MAEARGWQEWDSRWQLSWRRPLSQNECSQSKIRSSFIPLALPTDNFMQWPLHNLVTASYRMPKSQRPDGTVAGSTKRLASQFYQTKMGYYLSGQYLYWTKNRPTPQCWWCQYQIQTWEHLFKVCPEWKAQQKILWAEVQKGTVSE